MLTSKGESDEEAVVIPVGTFYSGSIYAAADLNTASVEELRAVKGGGASKAEAIVQHRKQHGPFKRVEDLDNAKGFGKKTVDRFRSEFTVSKPDKK